MAFLTPRHPQARRGARHLDTRWAPLMVQRRQGCDSSITKISAKLAAHGGSAFPGVPPPREAGGARSSIGCLRQQNRSRALSMSITISKEKCEALCTYFESTFDSVAFSRLWQTVEAGELETANRIAMEYSQGLYFIVKDLHWGVGLADEVELSSDPQLLRRVFTRVREDASRIRANQEPEQTEARQAEERIRLLEDACQDVLSALDGRES
jgi:hypothetical protein